MNDFLIDFAFSTIITVLRQVVKNPNSREQMKKVFRKVYDLTLTAYPEFRD